MVYSTGRTCSICWIPESHLPDGMKQCARCKAQLYCSLPCLRVDSRRHELSCQIPASEPLAAATNTNTAPNNILDTGLCQIIKPFTAIKNGTWLHNRPEKDVYKLLIDVYRLRMEEQPKPEGEVDEGRICSDASPSLALEMFREYLVNITRLDDARPTGNKLLPEWWSQIKLEECVELAKMDEEWSGVDRTVEKSDIMQHYRQPHMPMQLRMFGEKIDGTITAGASCEDMLGLQCQIEEGGGRTLYPRRHRRWF